jgi:Tol biopolymer transport system component
VEWNIDIWTLPVDANGGQVRGDLQRVTRRAERDILPTISRDGKVLAHLSDGEGAEPDVLTVNLANGEERNLTSSRAHEFYSVVSRDGSRVAYIRRLQPDEDDKYSVYQAAASGDVATPIAGKVRFDQRLRLGDWTPDLSGLVTEGGRLDVATGEITEIFGQGFRAHLPKLSPDGKWVVFSPDRKLEASGTHQLVIAPFRITGPPISGEEWISITTPPGKNSNADWSPDGNRLYFLSNRDGHRCLWTQRLDPVNKTPAGEAREVQHFPRADLTLATEYFTYVLGPSVAADKIALGLIESRGNVWMVQTDLGR